MNNRLARYIGDGRVEIVEESLPDLPKGGLLVRTEACGLCSGELMSWYMDRKLPHVLGHEVAGLVEASDDARLPTITRLADSVSFARPDAGSTARRGGAPNSSPAVWRIGSLLKPKT